MSTIRQVIRMLNDGESQSRISSTLKISRNTVGSYFQKFKKSEIDFNELLQFEDADLIELFDERKHQKDQRISQLRAFLIYTEKELRRPGVTRELLWKEYKSRNRDGYGYTKFCNELKLQIRKSDIPIHLEHKAGDKLYIDFTGKKLSVIDKNTGKETKAEVFVAIFPASQLIYVEAVENQKAPNFITALTHTLNYAGGVPLSIVPDNLKSAVIKNDNIEPVINKQLEAFAAHYGTVILPTRAYRPRDKAYVEGAVKIVYQKIFAPIRNMQFFSIIELNNYIYRLLEDLNNLILTGRNYSRRDLFEEIESCELKKLPEFEFEIMEYMTAKVYSNSHIWLGIDKHYYSVPYSLTGRKVKIAYNERIVEIYYDNRRVALHRRNRGKYRYTTTGDHMPSNHKVYSEWNSERFIAWAEATGESTAELIKTIIDKKDHPEQAYRISFGILTLSKKYDKERVEEACKMAVRNEAYSYHTVKNILEKNMDKNNSFHEPEHATPDHENIRGKEYYH